MRATRREFLQRSAAAGAAITVGGFWGGLPARGAGGECRPTVAAIGVGGSRSAYHQGASIARKAAKFGRVIACADVDDLHAAEFNKHFDGKLALHRDYRKLLEEHRPDIVTIGTPDHWHVPIAIAAMRAGCDVYCEKPLTLTIEEGFRIREAVAETGRVFQVGTQQRSEYDARFLKAIAIVQSGRLGKKVNAFVAIDSAPTGGPFPTTPVPKDIDWDLWLGPAQKADFSEERRKGFRWYFDYSGGKMTDWGGHHVDIAQWALGHGCSGPTLVAGYAKRPPVVPGEFSWRAYLEGESPLPNAYHTPSEFAVDLTYGDGSRIHVTHEYSRDDGRTKFSNGILFEGEEGRIFVNRERLTGKPIEELTEAERKDLDERVHTLYGGQPGDHMRNFFDCVESRGTPISDVETQHRTTTACHLANIFLMLGREIRWDPATERIVGDEQATALVGRLRREKYSLPATT